MSNFEVHDRPLLEQTVYSGRTMQWNFALPFDKGTGAKAKGNIQGASQDGANHVRADSEGPALEI